jgi:hypothetical protein
MQGPAKRNLFSGTMPFYWNVSNISEVTGGLGVM